MKSNHFIIFIVSIILCACNNVEPTSPSVATDGVLPGAFSVSRYKQVHFSQGNLQYQASTDTWRFASRQFDIVGENNRNISPTYQGWIDLFGYGTADNPTNSSMSIKDYTEIADWGKNTISNGGDNKWYTLSPDEWSFLVWERSNYEELRCHGTVCGVHGYIILPDDWIQPSDIDFKNFPHEWTTNVYTANEWTKMEALGAVFLPAAGWRGRLVGDLNIGKDGHYWAYSSKTDDNVESFFQFYKGGVHIHALNRYYGMSVRLVCDSNNSINGASRKSGKE